MRALITGGIGFIGTNLAERLLRSGSEVVLYDSAHRVGVRHNLDWLRDRHRNRFEFIEADIRDARAVAKAMRGADAVFHFAAQVAVTTSITDPVEDFAINAQGTMNVLEAARRLRPHPIVLFTSTNKVYGALEHLRVVESETRYEFADLPWGVSEATPLDFHSPYGCSKGAADQYVRDYHRIYGLPTVVLRMSCIYGPRQFGNEDQGWVAHFLLRALHGGRLTIYGDGKQVRDLLYIEDLLELMQSAIERIGLAAGKIYNVGGGPQNTISIWAEFREELAQLVGGVPQVERADFRPGDQRVYVSDIRKAQQELGWTPKFRICEGLERLRDALLQDGIVELQAARSQKA